MSHTLTHVQYYVLHFSDRESNFDKSNGKSVRKILSSDVLDENVVLHRMVNILGHLVFFIRMKLLIKPRLLNACIWRESKRRILWPF